MSTAVQSSSQAICCDSASSAAAAALPWHWLSAAEEEDAHSINASLEGEAREATAATAATRAPPASTAAAASAATAASASGLCHVRLHSSALHTPVVPSLVGRANQRLDGERRLVCGCVAFRVDAAAAAAGELPQPILRVLLVNAKRNDWIFPKGGWESHESAAECAARECMEEGGVEGDIVAELRPIEFASKKGKKNTRLTPFLLRAHTHHVHFAEEAKRKRRWVRFEAVDALMEREETKDIWQQAKEALRRSGFLDASDNAVFKPDASKSKAMSESKEQVVA